MNKQDLLGQVSTQSGLTKADTQKAVDAIFNAISEGLIKGEATMLVGFGGFKVTKRAAREGRNPRTGEAISIAASKSVKFSPGKALKEAIN